MSLNSIKLAIRDNNKSLKERIYHKLEYLDWDDEDPIGELTCIHCGKEKVSKRKICPIGTEKIYIELKKYGQELKELSMVMQEIATEDRKVIFRFLNPYVG